MFIQYLLQKLKTGDGRSININALPGKLATRFDIMDLFDIDKSLINEFFTKLTTQSSFKFKINLGKLELEEDGIEKSEALFDKPISDKISKKKRGILLKRLNTIIASEEDEFQEHGVRSFGFGYPLLIKKENKDFGEDKIVASPLFVRKLTIERLKTGRYTYQFSRDDEMGVGLNEVLLGYLDAQDHIKINQLSEDIIDDGVIDIKEMLESINNILKKCGSDEYYEKVGEFEKIPLTKKELQEYYSEQDISRPVVFWGGVFGLYRTLKEKIIEDTKKIPIEALENGESEKQEFEFEHPYGCVSTDPSQQTILDKLPKKDGIIIQGPPGTGKSQTITAIITNALDSGKKCLVVCEKKTALEVIKNNLSKVGLGDMCALIEDVYTARKDIVDLVRNKQEYGFGYAGFKSHEYESTLSEINLVVEKNINQRRLLHKDYFNDTNRKLLVGEYLKKSKQVKHEIIDELYSEMSEYIKDCSYYNYDSLIKVIKKAEKLSFSGVSESFLNKIKKRIFIENSSYISCKNEYERLIGNFGSIFNKYKSKKEHFENLFSEFNRDCLRKNEENNIILNNYTISSAIVLINNFTSLGNDLKVKKLNQIVKKLNSRNLEKPKSIDKESPFKLTEFIDQSNKIIGEQNKFLSQIDAFQDEISNSVNAYQSHKSNSLGLIRKLKLLLQKELNQYYTITNNNKITVSEYLIGESSYMNLIIKVFGIMGDMKSQGVFSEILKDHDQFDFMDPNELFNINNSYSKIEQNLDIVNKKVEKYNALIDKVEEARDSCSGKLENISIKCNLVKNKIKDLILKYPESNRFSLFYQISYNTLSLFSNKHKEIIIQRKDINLNIIELIKISESNGFFELSNILINTRKVNNFSQKLELIDELLEKVEKHKLEKITKGKIHSIELNTNIRDLQIELKTTIGDIKSNLTQFLKVSAIIDDGGFSDLNLYEETLKKVDQIIDGLGKYEVKKLDTLSDNDDLTVAWEEIIDIINDSNTILDEYIKVNKSIPIKTYDNVTKTYTEFKGILDKLKESKEIIESFYDRTNFYNNLSQEQSKVVDIFLKTIQSNWENLFEIVWLKNILLLNDVNLLPKNDQDILKLYGLINNFKDHQIKGIKSKRKEMAENEMKKLRYSGITIQSLYNKRGAPGERRNSLRRIIATNFDLFTSIFPVVLVSPQVCSSILPLDKDLFDIVLFDEASQIKLEDVVSAMYRGKQKVICGDQHQMPPTNFFAGSNLLLEANEDDIEENDNDIKFTGSDLTTQLANSESLLDYAEKKGYFQYMLKVHYRSEHPILIDFSNHAFYGSRLQALPNKQEYTPISFYEVDGELDKGVNEKEAVKVIQILQGILSEKSIAQKYNGTLPSIGIATFNMYQRNYIWDLIQKIKYENTIPELTDKLDQVGLFVKNLDTIQGDERDIIIISTTFAKKSDGKFAQNYGPINQSKGYRLLNVMITRAKKEVHLITSIPSEVYTQFEEKLKNSKSETKHGGSLLHAYINYCKAVHENNEPLRLSILEKVSGGNTYQKQEDEVTESPFEEEVLNSLCNIIDPSRIKLQYKVGGFRVDIIILSKKDNKPLIAIECDGATYHSGDIAYCNDIFRQSILEGLGFIFHRIWSTNWWRDRISEERKLQKFLEEMEEK